MNLDKARMNKTIEEEMKKQILFTHDDSNWSKVDEYTFKFTGDAAEANLSPNSCAIGNGTSPAYFTGAITIGSAQPTHKETFRSYVNYGQLNWEVTFLDKNDVIQKAIVQGTNINEAKDAHI